LKVRLQSSLNELIAVHVSTKKTIVDLQLYNNSKMNPLQK